MSPRETARVVLEALLARGAGFVAHSPGARNLPLLAALRETAGLDAAECVDERAAGYLALGWMRGRALAGGGLPPALAVCTSGGAALNLLPAAAEAAESGLPLVVLCADRPPEEIGRGGNQTIDQLTPFAAVARHQLRLSPDAPDLAELERVLERWTREPGVLQLDLPFREPLLAQAGLGERQSSGPAPLLAWPEPPCPVTGAMWRQALGQARRGLVWACDLPRREDRRAARELAARLDWPLLADPGAGPGGPGEVRHGEDLLPLLDSCEAVLQLGRRPLSRRLLECLHRRPGVVVDDHPGRQDPLGVDRPRWWCRPAALAEQATDQDWRGAGADPAWRRSLERAAAAAGCRRALALGPAGSWSEAAVARRLAAHLPEDTPLLAGNSLPVRLLDQWTGPLGHGLASTANRGLSGIDGQLATALGVQRGAARPAACLLGDLGLLHDLSSLALWARLGWPLLTVVLHNGGGGIFRLHPDSRGHDWATSPHGLPLAEPARALGLEAARVETVAGLDRLLESWREDPRPLLVEARVPGDDHPARVERVQVLVREGQGGGGGGGGGDAAAPPPPARRVWLHGFLGSPADWDEVRTLLPKAAGGECAPWLPGHGPAPAAVPPTLDEWLDPLLETIGGEDPLDLIGYSLGGRLALRLALRLPGRVRSLVLLGASPGLAGVEARAARRAQDGSRAAMLRREGLEAFLDTWYALPLFATLRTHPRFPEWRNRRAAGQAEALSRALEAASPGAQPDLGPALADLAMPVLWLAGGLDAAYAAQVPRAAERCPDGRWARIPGVGHAAQLEDPAAVAERIAAFLAE